MVTGRSQRKETFRQEDPFNAIKKEEYKLEDLCFSLQETAFSMVTEVTERALAHTEKKEVLLTGGVAANKRLQQMLNIMCDERGANFFVVPMEYSGDNGSMIAWNGIINKKPIKIKESKINQKWRVDQVEINWM